MKAGQASRTVLSRNALEMVWQRAWDVVEAELGRAYTAAAGAVIHKDASGRVRMAYMRASGKLAVDNARAVDEGTLFDLASLTKVVATTSVVLKLCEAGVLDLDAPLSRYLPEWQPGRQPDARPDTAHVASIADKGKTAKQGIDTAHGDGVTIRRLLTHTSGLVNATKAYIVAGERAGTAEGADIVRNVILSATPVFPPGSRVHYTDWGFILLGLAAEAVTGESLDVLARRLVFEPLGMSGACYTPTPGVVSQRGAAASWEATPPDDGATDDDLLSWEWRQKHRPTRKTGIVHDNTAYVLGGVAGHAGLFASVADLVLFVAAWLADGKAGSAVWLRPETVRLATSDQTHLTTHATPPTQKRGLGWLLNSETQPPLQHPRSPCGAAAHVAPENLGSAETTRSRSAASFFGQNLSHAAYGHTGFTGTALWVDPALGIGLVLLTNAVHLSRGSEAIQRVRREFVGAVTDSPKSSP